MCASKNQVNLVALKLQVLEDERKQLHESVDVFVDEVVSLGTTFVASEGGQGLSFKEVSQAIERALTCVMERRAEYSQAGGPELKTVPAQSVAPSGQPLAALPAEDRPHLVQSSSSLTENVLGTLRDWMDLVQGHVRTNGSNLDILSAMVPQILAEIGAIKDQVNRIEGWKDRLDDIDNRVTHIEEDDTIPNLQIKLKEVDTNVCGLASQFEKHVQEFVSHTFQNESYFRDVDIRLGDVQVETKNLNVQADKLTHDQNVHGEKISSLEAKDEEKSKVLDKMEVRLQKEEKESFNLKKSLEEKFDLNGRGIEDLNVRLKKVEEMWSDRELKNVRKMEDKLQRMEAERKKDVYYLSESVEKIHSRLDTMATTENSITTRILNLEKRHKRPLGFTAKLSVSFSTPIKRAVIRDFTDIVVNKGDHYQPQTGEFIAPVEGLYVVALSHRQWQDGEIWLVVLMTPNPGPNGGKDKVVCETKTDVNRTSSCGYSAVWMNPGDKVWVSVRNVKGTDVWIDAPSSFSCFLVA
ncbi:uncharacterized protein LOC131948632 [Physella acuta]|uniref:uncharacterized protein LOC131948632 n=1 Tax=Physella acuta TaxID=109671 RepID=UPI0027DE0EBA|nr:uncharacterized protein LOC131948632 [Physella acuta]